MIKENELTEIRKYLLTKKLPIDILLEVQDHFISQISDLMKDENRDFNSAFDQVKETWRRELMPYWRGEMNLEDTSDFVRKIKKEINYANLRVSLKWGSIPVAVLLISAFVLPAKSFGLFTVGILAALLLFTTVNYFRHLSDFKISRKYPNHILTLHQHSVMIFFLILGPLFTIFVDFIEKSDKIQSLLRFEGSVFEFVMVLMPIALVSYSCFYSLSAQKNYLRQIEKIKPFLRYL